jgi:hypothetical protein
MKKIVRIGWVLAAVVIIGCLTGGCLGGISLFSSTHTHYENRPDIDERIKTLEKKMKGLETMVHTNRVSCGQ